MAWWGSPSELGRGNRGVGAVNPPQKRTDIAPSGLFPRKNRPQETIDASKLPPEAFRTSTITEADFHKHVRSLISQKSEDLPDEKEGSIPSSSPNSQEK